MPQTAPLRQMEEMGGAKGMVGPALLLFFFLLLSFFSHLSPLSLYCIPLSIG